MVRTTRARHVDCEYMAKDSFQCRNKELNNDWFHSMFPRICIEQKLSHVDCKERVSVWDMLKNSKPPAPKRRKPQAGSGKASTLGNWPPPPPPPKPPPVRTYYNDARIYPEDDEKDDE